MIPVAEHAGPAGAKYIVEPGWLTREGAEAWSGLSLSSIDKGIRQRKFHSRLKGRTRLIERESFNAWIDSDEWLDDPTKEGTAGSACPGGGERAGGTSGKGGRA